MNIFIKATLTESYGRNAEVIDDDTEDTFSFGQCKFRTPLYLLNAAYTVYSTVIYK